MSLIPFNRLATTGNIIFASRGSKIHSFNLSESKHVSSWQHPDLTKAVARSQANGQVKTDSEKASEVEAIVGQQTRESEPPRAKRQKVAGDEANDGSEGAAEVPETEDTQHSSKNGQRRGKKQSKGIPNYGDRSRMGRALDCPLITLMACTREGNHLVAVSGHDKTVWVFEHDGAGNIAQLSQRTMPKRPSAIAIGFGPEVLVADKFGDVYSIPLLMTPVSPSGLALRAPAPAPKTSNEPAANTLTVHSKRNRAALEAQRKQLQAKKAKGSEPKPEGPGFELSLLLGHVSMLTALVVAQSRDEEKRYILTADRDEHIRVSRYMPQAYIIEGFCLGHKEFVSDMMIPNGRENVLVSGGGDEDLLVWDWKAGKLLSTAKLLSLARELDAQLDKVSVSCLASLLYPTEDGPVTYILAICEDLKALFTWQLTHQEQLKNPSIIQLPCNPLHLCVTYSTADASPRLVVAMDTSLTPDAPSLHQYTVTRSEGRLSSDKELPIFGQNSDDAGMRASDKDIRDMFYTVNKLRKQSGADDGAPLPGSTDVEDDHQMQDNQV